MYRNFNTKSIVLNGSDKIYYAGKLNIIANNTLIIQ